MYRRVRVTWTRADVPITTLLFLENVNVLIDNYTSQGLLEHVGDLLLVPKCCRVLGSLSNGLGIRFVGVSQIS